MDCQAYLKKLSRKLYLSKLPKKRMGAGCLLLNDRQQLLILKPTYRNGWLLPGGVIELNESPRQACIREVKEETGITCESLKLLCVDYVYDHQENLESVQFVFLGEIIKNGTYIILPEREIKTYQFLALEQAIPMLTINSRNRLESCVPHLDSQTTLYLENGKIA